jgi:hypothetical protein
VERRGWLQRQTDQVERRVGKVRKMKADLFATEFSSSEFDPVGADAASPYFIRMSQRAPSSDEVI